MTSDRRRRRRSVAVTAVTAACLLRISLSSPPGSKRFYGLTFGAAGVLAGGALASGPISRGGRTDPPHRPVGVPVLAGAAAFGSFYPAALVVRRIPPLRRAIASVLQYAHQGSNELVLLTALVNGAAEELFYRGALYDAIGPDHPVAKSTAVYVLVTVATGKPVLVLASTVMGALFAAQRERSGGIQAPMLTHLTWSTLMLRCLPPLFTEDPDTSRLPV